MILVSIRVDSYYRIVVVMTDRIFKINIFTYSIILFIVVVIVVSFALVYLLSYFISVRNL